MLNEIPQISCFHAEPTKRYTMNRRERNRSRLIVTTKEHMGGVQRRERGTGGGGGVGERMSECHW